MLTKQRKRRRRSQERGQAMVEYSVISHAILGVGITGGWPFFTVLMNAFDTYYDGIFYVLTSPVP